MTTQKNVHDNEPDAKNLVKPGSTIDPSKGVAGAPPAPAGQGQQQGQPGQQQGQPGPLNRGQDASNDMERMRNEDPLFIEKTRPEDPSGRPGQLTRDNVNPHIPSGERGAPTNAGGIVDPTSLGMEQGGVPPTSPMQPENPIDPPPAQAKAVEPPHDDDEAKRRDRK